MRGTAFHWTDVLVVAAWGLAGLALAHALLQLGTPPGMTPALPSCGGALDN
jgi:hypothetical protein